MNDWQWNAGTPAPSASASDQSRSRDRNYRSPHQSRKRRQKSPAAIALEWALIIIAAVGIAALVRAFLFQPFYIPSESMVPTLQVGDKVLVNQMSYRLHGIRRGDIVVFNAPESERTPEVQDFVKRVIALPGETIQGKAGDGVYINGRKLEEPYLPEGTIQKDFGPVTVPAGQIFVMGDNRPESKDSTVFGPIPESSVVGRVFLRYWPPGRAGVL
jgi:signal peptidase I